MEDFIRLNLNVFICAIPVILILIMSLIIILKSKDKEARKFGIMLWNIALAIGVILLVGVYLTQMSVNQLEKIEINK